MRDEELYTSGIVSNNGNVRFFVCSGVLFKLYSYIMQVNR